MKRDHHPTCWGSITLERIIDQLGGWVVFYSNGNPAICRVTDYQGISFLGHEQSRKVPKLSR